MEQGRRRGWGGGEEGEGSSLSLHSLCEKKLPDFSNSKQSFFLIRCLAVAKSFSVFSLVQHVKGGFLLKKAEIFFSFNVFSWTCKYFYCHCIYDCVKNINFLYFKSTKKLILFSVFTHRFFIRKFISVAEFFLKRGGNSIKWK